MEKRLTAQFNSRHQFRAHNFERTFVFSLASLWRRRVIFPKAVLDVQVRCETFWIEFGCLFSARFGFQSHSHEGFRSHQLRRPLDPSRTPSATIKLRTDEMAAASANFL